MIEHSKSIRHCQASATAGHIATAKNCGKRCEYTDDRKLVQPRTVNRFLIAHSHAPEKIWIKMTQMPKDPQYSARSSNTHAQPRDEYDKGTVADAQAYPSKLKPDDPSPRYHRPCSPHTCCTEHIFSHDLGSNRTQPTDFESHSDPERDCLLPRWRLVCHRDFSRLTFYNGDLICLFIWLELRKLMPRR